MKLHYMQLKHATLPGPTVICTTQIILMIQRRIWWEEVDIKRDLDGCLGKELFGLNLEAQLELRQIFQEGREKHF